MVSILLLLQLLFHLSGGLPTTPAQDGDTLLYGSSQLVNPVEAPLPDDQHAKSLAAEAFVKSARGLLQSAQHQLSIALSHLSSGALTKPDGGYPFNGASQPIGPLRGPQPGGKPAEPLAAKALIESAVQWLRHAQSQLDAALPRISGGLLDAPGQGNDVRHQPADRGEASRPGEQLAASSEDAKAFVESAKELIQGVQLQLDTALLYLCGSSLATLGRGDSARLPDALAPVLQTVELQEARAIHESQKTPPQPKGSTKQMPNLPSNAKEEGVQDKSLERKAELDRQALLAEVATTIKAMPPLEHVSTEMEARGCIAKTFPCDIGETLNSNQIHALATAFITDLANIKEKLLAGESVPPATNWKDRYPTYFERWTEGVDAWKISLKEGESKKEFEQRRSALRSNLEVALRRRLTQNGVASIGKHMQNRAAWTWISKCRHVIAELENRRPPVVNSQIGRKNIGPLNDGGKLLECLRQQNDVPNQPPV